MYQNKLLNELIIDNFAGGGGASVGIELATGRPVDIAINHDADAIAMHSVNHPYTQHFQEDVFAINPEEVTGGRPVGIAWFSPEGYARQRKRLDCIELFARRHAEGWDCWGNEV